MKKYLLLIITLFYVPIGAINLIFQDTITPHSNDSFVLNENNEAQNVSLLFGKDIKASLNFNKISNIFEMNKSLNLQNNELINFRIENRSVAPLCDTSQDGLTYLNTNENEILSCIDNKWLSLSKKKTSTSSPTPYIKNIYPSRVTKNTRELITINGNNFEPNSEIQIKDFPGTIENKIVYSPEKISIEVLTPETPKQYTVTVKTGNKSSESFSKITNLEVIDSDTLPIESDLLLWVDANHNDSFQVSSGKIAQLTEKSPHKFIAQQFNVAYQPHRVEQPDKNYHLFFNGNQSLSFGSPTNLDLSKNISVFIVKKSHVVNGRRNMIHKNYAGEFSLTNESNGSYSWYWGSGGYGQIKSYNGANTPQKRETISLVRNTSSLKQGVIFKNNKNALLPNSGQNNYIPRKTTSPLMIGDGYVSGFVGEINEIIIYNRALSEAEQKNIHQYLANKWNITE